MQTAALSLLLAAAVALLAACGGDGSQQSMPTASEGASAGGDSGNGGGVTIIEADDRDSDGDPAPSQAAQPGGTSPLFVSAGVFADGPRAGGRFERATLGDPDAPVVISDYADFL